MQFKEIKSNLYSLLKLAIPLALTGTVQFSAFFFEIVFLAHLGKDVLAAGALVGWLFATIAVIFFGAMSSINILVAHNYGANDHQKIAFVARDGILMAILFSIPIFILCWSMAPIFFFLGQSPAVISLAQAYLHTLSWGIIPNFLLIALLELVLGLGHARTVLLFSFLAVLLTIFFSYVLIFGKLGLPMLGIAGAGSGIAIGNIITFVVFSIFLMNHSFYKKYLRSIWIFKSPSYLRELLQIGLPMGLMYCVEVGFFFALTLIMGRFGTLFLAANQIAMQYLGLLMSTIFAIAQAITIRMGHLLGAKNWQQAKQVGILGICISASLMTLIAFGFWFFPNYLITIDFNIHETKNQELVYYALQLLMISPIFQLLESIRISLFGMLRALKDTKFTLLTSIISFWGLSLPFGYFFAIYFSLQATGFWWGMIVGVSISILMLIWRFKIKFHYYKTLHTDKGIQGQVSN